MQNFITFIKESPTAFHAVAAIERRLLATGYEKLMEYDAWNLSPGGKYFTKRNDSSLIAFQIPEHTEKLSFRITASHTDSPAFKVKENAELEVKGKYLQLNTEGYGGMICASWFDRPLSLAGRVVVKQDGKLITKLVNFEKDLLIIPNVAIHMNRKVNEEMKYNKQVDMLPLFAAGEDRKGAFQKLLADTLGTKEDCILSKELFVYNRMEPTVWGEQEELISSPRLDDLECVYGSLTAFLEAKAESHVNVLATFDNEEVGSGTKQGAASTFLRDVLRRINSALLKSKEDYYQAIANSFLVSCDNAHAVHPNHPEKTDVLNCVYMNEGVVIKSHAGQKYTSDAISSAIFQEICCQAGVPVQYFANRSDEAGGSTLGNIAMGQVSMNAVDIGLAQLAMHSAYETAGSKDLDYLKCALKAFYEMTFRQDEEGFSLYI